AAQRLRLLPVETRREDVALELFGWKREIVLGPTVLRKQLLRDTIDVDVGRLCRKQHRDEQLERILEAQRNLRVCVLECETFDHRPDARALRTNAFARLVHIAARHMTTLTDCR